jgi:predicted peptidase
VPTLRGHLLYLPAGYGEDSRSWPLLLFLHGAGERGDDLQQVKVNGPPRLIEEGRAFPFIVVCPQCPAGQRWSTAVLLALLDDLEEKYRVDPRRIYVTGLSMGGFGTWELGQEAPERFAALVPICGGGNPARASSLKDMPIWVFHGARDTVVPLRRSEEMVRALRALGSSVRLTVYPEAGHAEAWQQAYADPALWAWLGEQARPPEPEG